MNKKSLFARKPIGLIDVIVLLILVIACFLPFILTISTPSTGDVVLVKYDGRIAEYDLKSDNLISLKDGKIQVRIKDGVVSVITSDCTNETCVHSRPITREGESIICLPNGLVIEIVGNEFDLSTGG